MNETSVLSGSALYLRIIVGFLPLVLLLVFGTYLGILKYKRKICHWFIPIGPEILLWSKVYDNSRKYKFKKDYIIWASLSGAVLLYWFGSYFIVNLILLSNFQHFLFNNSDSIQFVWNDDFSFSSGLVGRFQIGNDSDLDFLFSQVNVRNYLYEALTYRIVIDYGNTGLLNNDAFYLNDTKNLLSLDFVKELLAPRESLDIEKIRRFIPSITSPMFDDIRNAANLHMKLWLHSFLFSNIFLTPLCQFLSLMLPVSIILSYKRDYATFFAPYSILGGLVTLIGGVAFDNNVFISWQFLLFENQGFFMYHSYILILGGCWFVYCHRYSFSRVLYLITIMFIFLAYVGIVTNVFNIQFFTTGVTEFDTTLGGSYGLLQEIFPPGSVIKFPTTVFFMLLLFLSLMYIMIFVKNTIHRIYWKKVFHNDQQSIINDAKSLYLTIRNKWRNRI